MSVNPRSQALLMNLFDFKKSEKVLIISVLLVIFILGFFNFRIALRRRRDFQRKEDVRNITEIVEIFKVEHGFYPEGQDGLIVGCNPTVDDLGLTHFEICRPGEILAGHQLPVDPKIREGFGYAYFARDKRYQVLASLENTDEPEYDSLIAARNIKCGEKICNFGLASEGTPLDKSLEEYENEVSED